MNEAGTRKRENCNATLLCLLEQLGPVEYVSKVTNSSHLSQQSRLVYSTRLLIPLITSAPSKVPRRGPPAAAPYPPISMPGLPQYRATAPSARATEKIRLSNPPDEQKDCRSLAQIITRATPLFALSLDRAGSGASRNLDLLLCCWLWVRSYLVP